MSTAYAVMQMPPDSAIGYRGYGAAQELWKYKGPEVILSGPYETGKTLAALNKFHALLCKYARCHALMLRKTYKSLLASAVKTFETKVLPAPPGDSLCPLHKYGGEKPDHYDYPNGSRVLLGGLDNPSKFLSAEFDFIYVNQAEELSLAEWELIIGRATGRAGNAPYTQVIGDCNPGPPSHWIKSRQRLKLLESRHTDNPTLYDRDEGQWTQQGRKTIATLDSLTGIRKQRGRYGLWVAAEGQVYEYDPAIHLIDRFEIPESWHRFRAIDFGYTNPFVCQWWAEDGDGRLYLYRELYMTGRTVRAHGEQIKSLSEGERILYTVADHDAEDRATLMENGIVTKPADKRVKTGIEKVQERLKVAGDGRPRLYVLRDSLVEVDATRREKFKPVWIEEEFGGYVYPDTKPDRPSDEYPALVEDHSMDAMRYAVMSRDGGRRVKVAWA